MYGEREAKLGRVKEEHVYDLRERFIPLAELLAVDHKSPLYNEGDRRGVFYAESWALVHYLLIGNPKRKGQLAAYLREVRRRRAVGTGRARGLRRQRERAREGAAALRVAVDLSVDARPASPTRSRSTRTGPSISRARPTAQAAYRGSAAGGAPPRGGGDARRRGAQAGARPRAGSGGARPHPRRRGPGRRRRDADGSRRQGRRRHRLPAGLLPGPPAAPRRGQARTDGHRGDRRARRSALLQRVTMLEPSLADAHGLAAYAALVADEPKAAMASAAAAFKLSQRHEYALLHARARVYPARLRRCGRRSDALVGARLERLDPPRGAGAARFPRQGSRRTGRGRRAPPRRRPPPGRQAGWHVGRLDGLGNAAARDPGLPRRRRPGEVRELGMFEGVECPRGGGDLQGPAARRGSSGSSATAFDQVEFFTYRSEPPGQVACGARPKPERIYLTYRVDGRRARHRRRGRGHRAAAGRLPALIGGGRRPPRSARLAVRSAPSGAGA